LRSSIPLDELIASDDPDKLINEAKNGPDYSIAELSDPNSPHYVPLSSDEIADKSSPVSTSMEKESPVQNEISDTMTADQLAEVSNPANAYVDSNFNATSEQEIDRSGTITAEQLEEISNPANAYADTNQNVPLPDNVPTNTMTAEELADISNPANAYVDTNTLSQDQKDAANIVTDADKSGGSDGESPQESTTEWDENGNSAGSTPQPDMNRDTAALTQTGTFSNPGFFGDQSLKNSDVAFNKAVNMCVAVAGYAANLKRNKAPRGYVRSPRNYLLTEREMDAIERKSGELSLYGIIPYDVLNNFFYILAAVESEYDMIHIARVVGIPQLEDPRFIRNILGILAISDIYKIGYLANGVASIINTFASKYSGASAYANPYETSFGNVQRASDLSRSLGVLGPLMLSTATNFNGDIGILRNSSGYSASSIDRTIQSTIGLSSGSAIGLAATALTHPTAAIKNVASAVGANAIRGLINSTPLGGVLNSFGPLGALVAGPLLEQFGGNAIGNFMSELITGSRIPTQRLANNPSLRPPSYAGKCFFGETPCALPAVDQVFCRKVGSFGNPMNGSGTDSFEMQNFASFGGALNIGSVVARMVTGSSIVPDTSTYYGQSVNSMIGNVCSVLNVPLASKIEMRRSDNAIPFVIGLSAAIAEETFSPFGSKPISQGWKLASSTSNDVQRYNPQYLEACRTSL
jgi:hypothetical protein